MKRYIFPLLLVLGLHAKAQTEKTDPKWTFQGNFLLQNTLFETTVGSEKILRSTNQSTKILFGRSISKAIALNISTTAEQNWVLDGHTFTSRTIGLGFSWNNCSPIKNEVTLSSLIGFSGYYRFLHGFKAPEGTSALKPDKGVLGVGVRLGFYANAGRFSFGPALNLGLDLQEFKFTNGKTLKFKESASIGFGFGFRL